MGFPGGTPFPDQHLGVLLEDRRFPGVSGCSRRWWGIGPMSSLRRVHRVLRGDRHGPTPWCSSGMGHRRVATELVGVAGRVVVISRDRMLIMSWFEPLAGIISDH